MTKKITKTKTIPKAKRKVEMAEVVVVKTQGIIKIAVQGIKAILQVPYCRLSQVRI